MKCEYCPYHHIRQVADNDWVEECDPYNMDESPYKEREE
jgi:hypothetical protein